MSSHSSPTPNNTNPHPSTPMLTTRPHLTTLRPSPSTVSYTVSTASPRQTLLSQCLHYFLLLHRLLLGLITLLTLYARAYGANSRVPLLAHFSDRVGRYPWVQVGPLCCASLFLVLRRWHTGVYEPSEQAIKQSISPSDTTNKYPILQRHASSSTFHLLFTSVLTLATKLTKINQNWQKNPSSPSAPSASKPAPFPPPTSSPATRASYRRRRSGIFSSMRRSGGSR